MLRWWHVLCRTRRQARGAFGPVACTISSWPRKNDGSCSSWIVQGSLNGTLSPIIMVQWTNHPKWKKRIIVEIHPFPLNHDSGQIIATKPPVGHPKWWWKVRESPQNPLNSGLGIIGSFAQNDHGRKFGLPFCGVSNLILAIKCMGKISSREFFVWLKVPVCLGPGVIFHDHCEWAR